MQTALETIKLPFDPRDVQGDVIIGLPKKAESFVFFSITNGEAFLETLASHATKLITSTADVKANRDHIASQKKRGLTELVPLVGMNVAFSATGLQFLGIDSVALQNPSFSEGQEKVATTKLGDSAGTDGVPKEWEAGFLGKKIHGVWIVAGATPELVKKSLGEIDSLFGTNLSTVHKLDGAVRPGEFEKHEHFGYLDGVSNPAIEGFTEPLPGQDVVNANLILTGMADDSKSLPSWTHGGSILAFRKLKQLVPEFDSFTQAMATTIPNADPEFIGARLTGRWKSGAPLVLDPGKDNLERGGDDQRNNHFDYADDQEQEKCPFAAHVRKMNPREGPPSGREAIMKHLIARRGIPYGIEVTYEERMSKRTEHDRGLLFACYQSKLEAGFQFLQQFWANNITFPPADLLNPGSAPVALIAGIDPIIGQIAIAPTVGQGAVEDRLFMQGLDPSNIRNNSKTPLSAWVIPKGGEYFFSPSISTLLSKFGAGVVKH